MRLIDADKIPVIFEPVAYSNDCPVALDRETVEELVKHCSVDAVPVVRCKDCLMHGVCRFEQGLGLDGYCSQAGRRTDG